MKTDLEEKSKVHVIIEATLDLAQREKTLMKMHPGMQSTDLRKQSKIKRKETQKNS